MGVKKRETLPAEKGVRGINTRGFPRAVRVVGTGRDLDLPPDMDEFAVGSDPVNNLVLDDRYVSGFHCSLHWVKKGRAIVLKDRQSRNGTYVNGMRVHETELEVGARIQVGSTTLALLGDGEGDRPAIELLHGEDPAFQKMMETAMRAADSHASVLLTGESGTGKELVARLIHESSRRAQGPFIPVNCAAIPRDLIESELFGHERGAFTGAHERRLGVFEQADGGTIFLDEIGELPLLQQPRLLRVLETRKLRRVGGQAEMEVDVRIVSATHKDLATAAREGEFRLDLFHRLCGLELRLPALRERPTDIPRLVRKFLEEAAPGQDIPIDAATMRGILAYPWPGNVRELRNAVQRAAMLGDGRLELRHLIQGAQRPPRPPTMFLPPPNGAMESPHTFIARETVAALADPPTFMTIDQIMKALIERALTYYGSYRRAAAVLGISKSSIYDKARQYGITLPRDGARRADRDAPPLHLDVEADGSGEDEVDDLADTGVRLLPGRRGGPPPADD